MAVVGFSGLTVLGLLVLTCEATTYTVGGSAGWDISADLPSWSAGKIFYIGDVLLFQYSQYHTVNQVDMNGFNSCNASNALLTSSGGNTTVPLATAGEKYFICGVFSHCLGGMKLQLSVPRNATAAAPSPAPELSPTTLSTLPQQPASTSGLPPAANGSSKCLRTSHLLVAIFCSIGALVWVFFLRSI